MRIAIDMQGAQTESRLRGIGRYTLSLALAMVRNRGPHEIVLALNGLFPETIEPIRTAFADLLPRENIRVWHVLGPVREKERDNDWRRDTAELVREAFLASLHVDVVHVTSMFEGYVDDAVTSIGRFDSTTPVCVTFYDLIPLLNPDQYLKPDPAYHRYYRRKVEHLHNAALLLAISDSSRREAIEHLGIAESRVTNISTAADAHFRPTEINTQRRQILLEKYRLSRPFVMYAGACDSRKNLDGLIRAYALLPASIRAQHQLLIVSAIGANERLRLERLASRYKLGADELRFTGYVSDEELLALYNLCKLFVFPSWHEGFGLPALEAMACGRAAIGSDSSSVPEVIGRPDALFDARSDQAIADKIRQVLTDDAFRAELERHGLEQAKLFSWDISARRAIAALEQWHTAHRAHRATTATVAVRPTLAFVAPLPPERTGVANYSAELLPALREHFDIELITDQARIDLPPALRDLPVHDVAWFATNGGSYDRIIYQIGNSPFHSHMLGLLHRHPGVVMLHDFFLSGLLADEELSGRTPGLWSLSLYRSHGYHALADRFAGPDPKPAKDRYPCNLDVLQTAQGIIVHSAHSQRLAVEWYGEHAADDWHLIPHLRSAPETVDRMAARQALGIAEDAFVVCSFGFVDPTKLSHRLLEAWLSSALQSVPACHLVFAGTNHGGDYGAELSKRIRNGASHSQIRITGWADMAVYQLYLQAADVGVQLRSMSRGETSGAVLDCMNYGLPTIVNAHGSMADLPGDAVWKLADEFDDAALIDALETLWRDHERRRSLGEQALQVIRTFHAPEYCAALYASSVEKFHQRHATGVPALISALPDVLPASVPEQAVKRLAYAIARSIPPKPALAQLLVDVSAIARSDLQTGIERVVRAQLSQLLRNPPHGYRVEPVYLADAGGSAHYRYAQCYTRRLLDIDTPMAADAAVGVNRGDVFYGADFCPSDVIEASKAGIYDDWRRNGVKVSFLIHDILPVTRPEFFPDQADRQHAEWLRHIAGNADRLICISQAVADEVATQPTASVQPAINVLHHGADIAASFPSSGLPDNAAAILEQIGSATSFLMVGTIEPRKGHLQTIAAFEQLWQEGSPAQLVIVGKEGWVSLPTEERRTIPQTMQKLRNHPELGKRLIWLSGISDEYLQKIYAACSCLLFASEAEGFGLPLIEAAQFGSKIIVRDIPVFREVAQEHAFYFNSLAAEDLAAALRVWLALDAEGKAPLSTAMQWNTWADNVQQLMAILRAD